MFDAVSYNVGYPIYGAKFLNENTLLVTGGGGEGNNGIPNKITALKVDFDNTKKPIKRFRELPLDDKHDSPTSLDAANNVILMGCNEATESIKAGENRHLRKFVYENEHLRFVGAVDLDHSTNPDDYTKLTYLSEDAAVAAIASSKVPTVIRIVNPETLTETYEIETGNDVKDLHFSPDGKVMAYITNGTLEVMSVVTGRFMLRRTDFKDWTLSKIRFLDNQTVLVAASVKQGGIALARITFKGDTAVTLKSKVVSKQIKGITSMDCSHGMIALAGNDNSLVLIKLADLCVVKIFKKVHTFAITRAVFSPDGEKLASVSAANTIHVIRVPKNLATRTSWLSAIFKFIVQVIVVALLAVLVQLGFKYNVYETVYAAIQKKINHVDSSSYFKVRVLERTNWHGDHVIVETVTPAIDTSTSVETAWASQETSESLEETYERATPYEAYKEYQQEYETTFDNVAETTEVPAETTEVSVETTEVPSETTEVPAETTEVPSETIEESVEVTKVVPEATEVSVQTTEVSVQTTEASVQTTEVPVETTEVPVETIEVPVETTEVSVETAEVPVQITKVVPETIVEIFTETSISTVTESAVSTIIQEPVTSTVTEVKVEETTISQVETSIVYVTVSHTKTEVSEITIISQKTESVAPVETKTPIKTSSIAETTGEVAQEALSAVAEIAEDAIPLVAEIVHDAIPIVAEVVQDTVPIIGDAVPVIAETIQQAVPVAAEIIQHAIPEASESIEEVSDKIDNVAEQVKENVPEQVKETVPEEVKETVPEGVKETVPEVVEQNKETIPKVVEQVEETIPKVVEQVKETIPKVEEKIKETVPEVVEQIEEIAPEVAEQVKETVPDVVEQIKETVSEVVEKIKETPASNDSPSAVPYDSADDYRNAAVSTVPVPVHDEL